MKKNLKIAVLAVMLAMSEQSIAQNIVTVTDCNLQGWTKQTQAGTTLILKNGIATPPLGKGSLEFSSPNVNFVRFRNTSYHNTLLSSITEFSYSTYVQTRENNKDVNYIVLLVDINNDGRTDDNLVFDPRYQSQPFIGNSFPDQGLSVVGTWQTWNMMTGAWWKGPPPRPDPDNGGAIFTLAAYISQYPDAKIINDAALGGGGIRLTGGAVVGIFTPNFIGNSDNFKIGVNGVTTTYDFEFTTANAGVDKNVIYGYGSNCITLNGSAAGGVAPYTYSWSPGGSSSNNAVTTVCPTTTTTYTLTVVDSKGCSRTDDVTVYVNDVRCGSKQDKVKICHHGEELCVAASAVEAHLNHGDVFGSCSLTTGTSALKQIQPYVTEKIKLQNYPNPFSTTTLIQYELPFDANITLKLYDISGKELRTFESGHKQSGKHLVNFNASNLQKGVYYYKLTVINGANLSSAVNKMLSIN